MKRSAERESFGVLPFNQLLHQSAHVSPISSNIDEISRPNQRGSQVVASQRQKIMRADIDHCPAHPLYLSLHQEWQR